MPEILINDIKKFFAAGLWLLIGFGVVLRIYMINEPNFFVFDEGYYLKFNFTRFVFPLSAHPPQNISEFFQAVWNLIRVSLGTGKPIWFVIVDSRAFWGGARDWAFPRLVSSAAGLLTLAVTYVFARKFTGSKMTALLSTGILAVMPGHVFYSRLAIQEAVSGLFFLSGLYFYLFSRNLSVRSLTGSLLLFFAYLSNYRLIILPGVVALVEMYLYFTSADKIPLGGPVRKFIWFTVLFAAGVIIAGVADKAQNMNLIFAWSYYQSTLAQKHEDWFNFLSYPYYMFYLESIVLGLLFFGNALFLKLRDWKRACPFLITMVFMLVFSVTSDRAARYMCVALPFVAISCATLIVYVLKEKKDLIPQWFTVLSAIILCGSLIPKAVQIAEAKSDYKSSFEFLRKADPGAKILSTQPWIQGLFAGRESDVFPAPTGYRRLMDDYLKGYHYLIIDPQAYISYTQSGEKFDMTLKDCLGLISSKLRPVKVFEHFNRAILERVVFEHNENLWKSITFLNHSGRPLGSLRIYPVKPYAEAILKQRSRLNQNTNERQGENTDVP